MSSCGIKFILLSYELADCLSLLKKKISTNVGFNMFNFIVNKSADFIYPNVIGIFIK